MRSSPACYCTVHAIIPPEQIGMDWNSLELRNEPVWAGRQISEC
jgi:hypothetical protein